MATIYTVRDFMGEVQYQGTDVNECNRAMAALCGMGFVDRTEERAEAPMSEGPDDPVASAHAEAEAVAIMADDGAEDAEDEDAEDVRSIGFITDGGDEDEDEDEDGEDVDVEDDDLMLSMDATAAGGVVEEAPSADVFAQQFAQQAAPTEADAYKFLGVMNRIFNATSGAM